MSQNAIVKEVVSQGVVRVSLMRQLNCSGGCQACDVCTAKPLDEITALASDCVGAAVGDIVEVASNAGNAISIAILVYLLPCLALLGGYLLGENVFHLSVGKSIALAAGCTLLSFLPIAAFDRTVRKRKTPEFTVLCVQKG